MLLSYGPYLIAFIAALVAIRGNTWNSRKHRPSFGGWITAIIALLALLAGVFNTRTILKDRSIDREIAIQRFVDLSMTMTLNNFTVQDSNLDEEEKLDVRFQIVDHPCSQLSLLMTSNATILSDDSRQIASEMDENCDMLRLEKSEKPLDFLLEKPNELISTICHKHINVDECPFVKANPLLKLMSGV